MAVKRMEGRDMEQFMGQLEEVLGDAKNYSLV